MYLYLKPCQHAFLVGLDLDTDQVNDLGLYAQMGLDMCKSLVRLKRKAEQAGDKQNLVALQVAAEAHPTHATEVHCLPAQHMRLGVVLLWRNSHTR
jgi:hypothetical protein